MKNDRIGNIYRILETEGTVTVERLSKEFGVSESSIRRDLATMEDEGIIHRFYGGAEINATQKKEESLYVRKLYNNDVKRALSGRAASLVKDGDIIYIDGGSTTSEIVDYIGSKNILVVTQAINLVSQFSGKVPRCLVLTGYLKKNTGMIVSNETIEQVKKLRFNLAFLGCNSIHPVFGYSASEDMEGLLKHAIIKSSDRTYVMSDSSKVNRLTFPQFAELSECRLITDQLVEDFDYSQIPEVHYMEEKHFRLLTGGAAHR
jgi:DeoR family fructose operon transcriptional repressor